MTKQHILAEIGRTAKANGGKPLGKSRFFQETGIKESDWEGKYWVRWGNAVSEAGFEPNAMQSAYDKNLLIEKFIATMRELGHFPTEAELRFKSHAEPSFPSSNTFDTRLGSKRQRAAAIQEYCKSRPGYEDVLALCVTITNESAPLSDNSADAEGEPGFVYLIKSGRYYKIGRSNAAGRREYELAIQLPERAVMVHVIRTDDPGGIEAYWHKRFEAKHKNGEWFDLSQGEVQVFKRRKFM